MVRNFRLDLLFIDISILLIEPVLVLLDLVIDVGDMAVYLLLVEVVLLGILRPDLKGVYGDGRTLYEFPFLEQPYKMSKGQFECRGIVLSELSDFP